MCVWVCPTATHTCGYVCVCMRVYVCARVATDVSGCVCAYVCARVFKYALIRAHAHICPTEQIRA